MLNLAGEDFKATTVNTLKELIETVPGKESCVMTASHQGGKNQ